MNLRRLKILKNRVCPNGRRWLFGFIRYSLPVVTSCLLFSFFFAARAAKEVNNGAGLSELNIVYAFQQTGDLLKACLDTGVCRLSESEKAGVRQVIQPIVGRQVRLSFERESILEPDLYRIETPIWRFNVDRLWLNEEKTRSYDLWSALELLLRIADESDPRMDLPQRVFDELKSHFSHSVIEGETLLDFRTRLAYLIWNDRSRILIKVEEADQIELTEEIRGHFPADGTCESVRFLPPLLQGWERETKGLRFFLLFRVQSLCLSIKATTQFVGEFQLSEGMNGSRIGLLSLTQLDGN